MTGEMPGCSAIVCMGPVCQGDPQYQLTHHYKDFGLLGTWVQGLFHAATKMKVDVNTRHACPNPLGCCCNIGAMARKVSVKCAIAGCHYQRKMTLAEREELRRVGRENNATAGLVCPAHVKAAFNFEFDDIDIDVPLEELLVEASKETPRWRVILTPLPRAADEPDSQSTPGSGDRVI